MQDNSLKLDQPYLAQNKPLSFVAPGSYADRNLPTKMNETREWSWGLGDVVNALVGAGLSIQRLNEHPLGFYQFNSAFVERDDGHYQLPLPLHGRFPLTFTIRATKP